MAFGLGLGNVSPSQSGKNFEGEYYLLFHSILTISFTFFVLEFGFFGVILIGVLNWMIFSDSLAVGRQDNTLWGAWPPAGPGWSPSLWWRYFTITFTFSRPSPISIGICRDSSVRRCMALRRGRCPRPVRPRLHRARAIVGAVANLHCRNAEYDS